MVSGTNRVLPLFYSLSATAGTNTCGVLTSPRATGPIGRVGQFLLPDRQWQGRTHAVYRLNLGPPVL